ncbi:nitric oxide reductase transcriptional regulator NorR [Pseudoalteromonas piscicida]|uniref:Nitric oxide reductase transcription regulator n=1 Tax=Pseudoalteromonas piscicida TaxID=43662 RepID=A0A2A5JPN3_PSEO7|nr:nitric oxide reductase transcriptional regulator NorR [Pseudoalteromonas piscicida]PCK31337.1 nitric oxide reductase transcription regulator [Pseudoalteromonas piscicida]
MNSLELSKLLELSMSLSRFAQNGGGSTLKHYAKTLLSALSQCVTADAIAVLYGDQQALTILACSGLSADAVGRRFLLTEQPRLKAIYDSEEVVSFSAQSELADPYDGLLLAEENRLPVHACMGFKVALKNNTVLVTFDSLKPDSFEYLSDVYMKTLQAIVSSNTARVYEAVRLYEHTRAQAHSQPQKTSTKQILVGESELMQSLKAEIELVASSEFNVLIQGDTGTGKELVAKHVHLHSQRKDAPFVQINCAALPDSIAESELFGHKKGAFTGADKDRSGKFTIADGGTLFLDEVGELSSSLQSKLLRVLQSGEVQAVGSDSISVVDVRVVAATNRDLKAEVKRGKFRADLYHRLSVYPLHVPRLQERLDDIPLLVGFFLEQLRATLNVKQVVMDKQALGCLLHYDWPGNVRELEHCVSRAALKAKHQQWQADIIEIHEVDISSSHKQDTTPQSSSPEFDTTAPLTMKSAVEALQKDMIIKAMERNALNWSAAARALDMDRANLVRLAKRLGLDMKKQLI